MLLTVWTTEHKAINYYIVSGVGSSIQINHFQCTFSFKANVTLKTFLNSPWSALFANIAGRHVGCPLHRTWTRPNETQGVLEDGKCCYLEETVLKWVSENTNTMHIKYTVHAVDWPFLSDGRLPVADNRDCVGSRSSAGLHNHIPQQWVIGSSCTEGQARFHSSPAVKTKWNVSFHLDAFLCTVLLK